MMMMMMMMMMMKMKKSVRYGDRFRLPRSSRTSLKTGTLMTILPGAWRYWVGVRTGWAGVGVLWPGEMASLIYNICLSHVTQSSGLAKTYREQFKKGDKQADRGNDGKTTSKSRLALYGISYYGKPRTARSGGSWL